ncbi:MAG: hemolysin III family protein [Bacteroidota bacterium]|nr:hemolysin III family protein [Bacteroidota bacterium]
MIKKLREPMNGFTHFIGILFAIVATVLMINESLQPYKPYHLISFCIFGAGMFLLYTSSTLYHWLRLSEDGIKKMRRVDHIMIFILIAATYTPICLVPLRETIGYGVLAGIWGTAILGAMFKIFWLTAPRWLSTAIYLLMAWIALFIMFPLIHSLPLGALIWLLIGGVFYTVGAVMYGLKKPNLWPGVLGFHEIFHIFVLLGTFSHFWMIYKYIILLG